MIIGKCIKKINNILCFYINMWYLTLKKYNLQPITFLILHSLVKYWNIESYGHISDDHMIQTFDQMSGQQFVQMPWQQFVQMPWQQFVQMPWQQFEKNEQQLIMYKLGESIMKKNK